jgi:N-hydroxyarylamine O-acetyltransferase
MAGTLDNTLSKQQQERVLQKLGFSNHPEPGENSLRAIYQSWCFKVPFDNVRKLIHLYANDPAPLPGDTATDFFEAWLAHGTGGTCWSSSGALYALLESLGFTVSRGIATMLVAPDLPPNHATVLVTCDKRTFLVDSSIRTYVPLLISDDCNAQQYPFNVKLIKRDDQYYIWWQPLHITTGLECRIDRFSAEGEEYQQRYERTRDWSPFNYQLASRLNTNDSIIGTAAGKWVELDAKGQAKQEEIDDEQRKRLLVERIGMSEEIVEKLPADRPTPPPPGSKTAQASSIQ